MDVTSTWYRRGRRTWVLALAATLALMAARSFAAGSDLKIKFNIPAGTLGKTILEFSDQAQVQTMYVSSSRAVAGARTRAVVGQFTATEALTRMLEGTGVTFEFETPLSVLLRPSPRSAARTLNRESEAVEQGSFATAREAMEAEPLQQVVVTGSLIRGLESITAPLIIMGQKEKKQAAYGTVQDVLRVLPQNFGRGASEDYSFNENLNRGFGINLRGLGMGATLVLVNGRRQPASGVQGDFIDVSTIPWSAVERIEVLADGSCALYGSDAITGVVNIIMREDLNGAAETQARFGNALGGADERLLSQSFGYRWEGGKWMLTYQYSERTALAAAERIYSANADKRSLGGGDLRSSFSSPGNILDPATQLPMFGIGEDGVLSNTINLSNQMGERDLLPDREAHSAFFTASQTLRENFDLFAEGRYNQRQNSSTERAHHIMLVVPDSNPFFIDPFGNSPSVLVTYNFLNDLGPVRNAGETVTYTGTLGIKTNFSNRWQATLSGHYGKERMDWRAYNLAHPLAIAVALADPNPDTAFNLFGSGVNNPTTLDAIRFTLFEHAVSSIEAVSFVMDGPLPGLPTGTPKLAVGLDQRQESLFRRASTAGHFSAQYEWMVAAAFAEVSLPLASRLNLSLAGRYEMYSEFGDTFNPKVGLRWTVNDSLRLRGSWGTSFRTPTLIELHDTSQDAAAMFPLPDPQSPSGFSVVLGEQGSNPNLHDETARTWTAGFDLASRAIPGLTWAVTYYATHYENRIWRFQPPLRLESLLTEDKWSPLVTRNPPRSEVERICRHPMFFGSRADCLLSSPTAILDVRLRNLSATTVKGVDMELKQALQTNFGSFGFELNGSYVLGLKQAVTPAVPAVDLIGTVLNPPKLRLHGVGEWSQHGHSQPGWSASLAANYSSSFLDENSLLVPRVPASATFDAQLGYRTAQSNAWFGWVDLILNAVNVLNKAPSFVDQEMGYDFTNAKPYGRVISLMLQKNW